MVKTETTPIVPIVQEPASKPVMSSEPNSPMAATATALNPPQILGDGGDELDVHKECVIPDSFKFVN